MRFFINSIKVIACISIILTVLFSLSSWRVYGVDLFGRYFTPEEVNAIIATAGDYIFWAFIGLVVFIFFKRKIKK